MNERVEKGARDAECVCCVIPDLSGSPLFDPVLWLLYSPLHTVAVQILFFGALLLSSATAPEPQAGSAGLLPPTSTSILNSSLNSYQIKREPTAALFQQTSDQLVPNLLTRSFTTGSIIFYISTNRFEAFVIKTMLFLRSLVQFVHTLVHCQ